MKKILVMFLAALMLMLSLPLDSHAGPWTLKQKKLWMEVFTRFFHSKYAFDHDADRSRWDHGGQSEIWDLEVKAEYGVTDRFNLLLGVPYTWSTWRNDWNDVPPNLKNKNEGFKEINFGAKYRITEKPVVSAVQVKAYVDTVDDQITAPDLYDYGDGIEFRAMVGKAFTIKKRPCYVSAESGYFWQIDRGNEASFANYVPIFAECGFSPFNWLMWKTELDIRLSHLGTGVQKDTLTWRTGPIINLLGRGFSSVEKGGDSSLNLELLIGNTAWGRGDANSERYGRVSAAWEYVLKVQALF